MPENSKPGNYRRPGKPQYRQDIAPPQRPQPAFPTVGMTLNTYQRGAGSGMNAPRFGAAPAAPVSRWRRARDRISVKRSVLTLAAILAVGVLWLGWKFEYNIHRLFGGSVLSIFSSTRLKGENDGRVNILLAGNSADDPGHQGGNLTDSIMILSVDTQNHTAFMLSIPRDLYVAIPGYGHQKINDVYPVGNQEHFSASGYPNGGMGLLERVVQRDFGITCDYYALIDYNAIKQAVNDVGGIDINIQSSDRRGLYDPSIDWSTHGPLVKLSNGMHHINGEQALDLARARGDAPGSYGFANSDFDRTANQRQMILALRQKATSAGVLTNPVRLGELFDAVGANVKTDFTLSDMHRLYDLTKGIGPNNIGSIGLNNANGQDLLANYRTASGESALMPAAGLDDYSDIQQYIQQLTSNNTLVREDASIVILNGTTVSGLAAQKEFQLKNDNISVSAVADANTYTLATTQIIDNSHGKMPATKKKLQQLFPHATLTTTDPYSSYQADFIVVLGRDQVSPASSSTTN